MINKGYTLFYYTDMGSNAVYSCNIILHYETGEAEKKKQKGNRKNKMMEKNNEKLEENIR
jgi:hypothetical protein